MDICDGMRRREIPSNPNRAGETIGRFAYETGMSREGFVQGLVGGRNSTYTMVMLIARALGMQLRITV